MTVSQSQTKPKPKSIEREALRWLFIAHFADGSKITQDESDRSFTRKDGTGSTFSDVLTREDELTAFELVHVDEKQIVTVDLKTGAFIVNGTPLHAHNQFFSPENHKLKLIYHRETRVEKDVKATVQEDGSIKEETVGTRHYVNRYFIGWSVIINGKEHQVTLAVG